MLCKYQKDGHNVGFIEATTPEIMDELLARQETTRQQLMLRDEQLDFLYQEVMEGDEQIADLIDDKLDLDDEVAALKAQLRQQIDTADALRTDVRAKDRQIEALRAGGDSQLDWGHRSLWQSAEQHVTDLIKRLGDEKTKSDEFYTAWKDVAERNSGLSARNVELDQQVQALSKQVAGLTRAWQMAESNADKWCARYIAK